MASATTGAQVFEFLLTPMLQCHNSCYTSLQHDQCNSGQLLQQLSFDGAYPHLQTSLLSIRTMWKPPGGTNVQLKPCVVFPLNHLCQVYISTSLGKGYKSNGCFVICCPSENLKRTNTYLGLDFSRLLLLYIIRSM